DMLMDSRHHRTEHKLGLNWLCTFVSLLTWMFIGTSQALARADCDWPAAEVRQDDTKQLAGFEPSEAALIEDGQPFTWADELVIRLLYRAPKLPATTLQASAQPLDVDSLKGLISEPTRHRLDVFRIVGQLVYVERAPQRAGAWTELPQAFLCRIKLHDRTIRVIVTDFPSVLLDGDRLDEPVSIDAFFARVQPDEHSMDASGPHEMQPSIPLFVGARLGWFPNRLDPARGVGEGQVILARHGFDLGLLEVVRKHNRQPLTKTDRPAFEAMLKAAADAAKSTLTTLPTAGHVDLFGILGESQQHLGDWVELEGNVKRVVPWVWRGDDGSTIEYCQVDLFVPLGDGSVRLRGADGQDLVFRGRFPVTCHVPQSLGPGEDWVGRRLVVRGFFYRLWSYESALTGEQRLASGQLSPLVLAASVTLVEVNEETVGQWLTWIMIGLLLSVAAMVSLYYGLDRRRKLSRTLPESISIP
ncbi:MAG TPA: hypothetical protein PKD54_02760, partial [Pirellulaceae bacterium]|nr:hypothetical protein [Pirellulaceae bacterium]